MSNIKIISLSFLWIAAINSVCACDDNREELARLCAPIACGQSQHANFTPEALEKHLSGRLMEKVALVDPDHRKDLVELILPWLTLKNIDKHEVALRYSLVHLTEKLALAPADDRKDVMKSLDAVVDLLAPNAARTQTLPDDMTLLLKMTRINLIASINNVDPMKLSALLASTLPCLKGISKDKIMATLLEKLK